MFETISRKFQLKFKDRAASGSILAEILKDRLKKEHIVVLGIPRGGVITADFVARKISNAVKSVDFDIIISRKLTDRHNKEQAIGAVMEDGTTYLDEEIISMSQIPPEYLEKEKAKQIQEIKRRKHLYCANKLFNEYEHLEDKTTILVDDGAATGATLIAACRWLRMKHTPKRLVIAVPVVPKSTVKLLEQESDAVEVVISPSSIFRSVEQFYQDFEQVPDDRVMNILRTRQLLNEKPNS
ncbi:MAG: phosphoribosyltransferase family protein [Candidatus Nitrosopolaris sp.]